MKILTQKIALFGFLEVEGKKNGVVNMTVGFCSKKYSTLVNSRRGKMVILVGSEQFLLCKEHNSCA